MFKIMSGGLFKTHYIMSDNELDMFKFKHRVCKINGIKWTQM